MPRRRLWVTLASGALVTLVLVAIGLRIDAGREELRDAAARAAAVSAMRAQFAVLDGEVRDLAGLFEASEIVEPEEFEAFARPMLLRSGAAALVLLRDIPDSERARVEREEGFPLREVAPDGAFRVAAQRPSYLAITRAVVPPSTRNLDGLDVLTLPSRGDAFDQVRRTGAVVATTSIRLAATGERGLLVFAPVISDLELQGVVAGAYGYRGLVDGVRRSLDPGAGLVVRAGRMGDTIGTMGSVPPGAEPTRIDYGGQAFYLTVVAAPDRGVPFAALGLGLGVLLTVLAVIVQGARYARQRLAIGEARFADAFEASPVGQGLASPDGRFARVNPALCFLTGHASDVLCERTAVDLVHPADRDRATDLVTRALAEPGVAAGAEVRLLTAGNAARWAQMHVTRLRALDAGHPLLTQVIDISERRGLEVELRHQAEHDALTELLNRRGFQRRLGAFLERGPEHAGAVMLIDLDHFKAVNDTLGHHIGDQVIHAAGAALRGSLRSDDIVARIGGDEFAVLLPGADRERAETTAERLVHAIATEARVADLGGGHGVSASVGVAMLGAFATADDALMAADLAMYDAKHAGRRRAAFYDDGAPSSTQTRLQWVDRIRSALADERLELLAQPILDLGNDHVHHEILLRMVDADGELLAPGTFLPIAEQFGLMDEIDRWVVKRAIGAIAANPDRELVFEINLSGSSLGSPALLQDIRTALADGGVSPACVIFEITETAAVTNLEQAHAFATELSELGCRFALDDFGVGFGSFTYVKHLPFDFLKIDGEFVRHSATSREDRVILESLIHAARGLGKRTIAEYVEDVETVKLLRELGVDMVQGFYIGGPRDLEAVIAEAPRSVL